MAVTKKIQIQNSSGTGYDSRNIGAEAEYVDVSRDSNGDIITDLDTQTVDSTESLAQTLKNLEDNTEIDSALSTTSTKAVQNKVVTGELNKKIPTYTTTPASWDTTPTQNSTKPITSGGVYNALQGVGANDNFIGTVAEWEALTDTQKEQYKTVDFTDDFNGAEIDPVPTQNSANAVASGGVYSGLSVKANSADLGTAAGKDFTTSISSGSGDLITSGAVHSAIQTLTNQASSISDEIADMNNVLGAKNLLPNKAVRQIISGVTFTVNSDGTVTVSTGSGGATSIAQFILFEDVANWHNMILSGAPIGASGTTYDLTAFDTQTTGENSCHSNEVVLDRITDGHKIRVFIRVRSGQIITTPITFKPMIRPASIADDTYVPYAMTNRELMNNLIKSMDVTVTLATNSSVSPWSTYGQIGAENIPSGYKVINAMYVGASSNYGGFTIKTDGGLYCYGKNTGAHTVRLLCIKN